MAVGTNGDVYLIDYYTETINRVAPSKLPHVRKRAYRIRDDSVRSIQINCVSVLVNYCWRARPGAGQCES